MKFPNFLSVLMFTALGLGKTSANEFIDPLKPTTNRDTMTFGPALEVVHEFYKQMPTAVAVSTNGRIFVTYPRVTNDIRYSLAEIVNGKEIPYPSMHMHPKLAEIQRANVTYKSFKNLIVSAQAAVLDSQDRLWVVDTGSILRGKTIHGGCKLLCIDLQTNKVVDRIPFSAPAVHDDSYIDDIRFDLSRGYAYMTDAGPRPGLIIVNLKTKKSWRRFNENPLTTATAKFVPVVAGVPVQPITNGVYGHMAVGADGISLNADGTRLYWCPLSSRLLYSIDTDLLTDPDNEDTDLEQSVTKHGDQGGGVGGLEIDSKDRLYLANYEHNLISRRHPDTGRIEPLVRDPRNIWPDTMQVADGYLYWTANQIVRANPIKPFYLFRVPIDAERVRL